MGSLADQSLFIVGRHPEPGRPLNVLELTVRDVPDGDPEILVPEGWTVPSCEIRREGNLARVTLRNAGLYTLIAFR